MKTNPWIYWCRCVALLLCTAGALLGRAAKAFPFVTPNNQANATTSGTMGVSTLLGSLNYQLKLDTAGKGAVQWSYPPTGGLPPQPVKGFRVEFDWSLDRIKGTPTPVATSAFWFSPPGSLYYGDSVPGHGSGLVIIANQVGAINTTEHIVHVYWNGTELGWFHLPSSSGSSLDIDYQPNHTFFMSFGGTSLNVEIPSPLASGPDWQFGFGGSITQPSFYVQASNITIDVLTAPFFTDQVLNQHSFQNIPISFDLKLGTLESPPENVTVTATTDNPQLLDSTNFTFTATSPTTRRVTVTPKRGQYGTAKVTLQLDPGGGGPTTTTTYTHVIEQNIPPTLQSVPPITQPQGYTHVLPLTIGSSHWPTENLVMSIDSMPTNLIDARSIFFLPVDTSAPNQRYLVFTPRLGVTGSGDILVRVTDPSGDSATSNIALTTTERNPSPTVLGAGTAISFDTATSGTQYGTSNGDSPGTDVGHTATLEAWVYATGLHDSTYNFIAFMGKPAPKSGVAIALQADGSPSLATWLNDSVPSNATKKVSLNQWHHVAAVLSGQSVTFYVDGEVSASGTLPSLPNVNTGSVVIGHDPDLKSHRRWTGYLDEIRIWNVARTPQEIAANYNRTVRADALGLLRYFRCDEGFIRFDGGVNGSLVPSTYLSGELVDSSVNQQSLSLAGFPGYVPGVPQTSTVDVEQSVVSSLGLATVITGASAWGSGGVVREIYFGPDSTALGTGLGASPGWPNTPDTIVANGFGVEVPPGSRAQYAQRIRGRILAPETGTYTFAIASANEGQLFLSTDANPSNAKLIATSPASGVSFRQFDAQPAQQTAKIDLVAGQQYYLEVRHQAGSGGIVSPHLSVQWTLPVGTVESPIPSYRLQPVGTPPPGNTLGMTVAEQPAWGTLAIAGNVAQYQPQPYYFGSDDFAFTTTLGGVSYPPALVEVNVLNRKPAPVAGSGNALLLKGASGGVQRSPGFNLGGNSFTVELWARRSQSTPPGSGNAQALFSFSGLAPTDRNQTTFGWFNDGRVGLQMSATLPNVELLSAATYHSDLDWHHWAAVFDATTGRREIFRDGVSLGSITNNDVTLGPVGLYLGSVSGLSGFFQGTIDEVRLWRRALTTDDLFSRMNTSLVGNEADLYLYYRLDEGNGLVAYDSSAAKPGGIRFDGTLTQPIDWTTNAAPALAQIIVPGNSRNTKIFLPGSAVGHGTLTYQIRGTPENGTLLADPTVPGLYSFTPTRGYSGTNVISYTVTDDRGLVSPIQTIPLEIEFVPIPPTISSIRDQEFEEEDPALVVPFTVTDEDQPDGSRLTFSVRSSNPTLLPAANIVVTGTGTSREVTLTPVDGEVGDSTIEITVNNGVRTATTSFEVRVNPRLAFAVVNAGQVVQQPSSFATAINVSGQLAGYAASIASPTNSRPFFYSGYGLAEQGFITANLGGSTGAGLAVNASGVMVGATTDPQGASVAFVIDPRQDSVPTALGVLPGGNLSVATDINDDGLIVGYAQTGDGTFRAFTAGNSALTPFALTNGYASMWATAVNNEGEIAGHARLATGGNTNAFLFADGLTQDLGRPTGADHVVVTAISDQGVVAGNGIFPSGSRSRVVTYEDGAWTDLGDMFGGGAAEVSGMNRFGQLVGRALTNGVWRAFLYSDGRAHDLTALSPGSGWTLTDARGINDRSQIAANGSRTNSINQALVLFPATEIGRRVFRPDGAIGENPTITILQGAGTDRWDNSFYWSALERKLYAIRPVVAEIRWRTGNFVTVTNETQFGEAAIRQVYTNEVAISTLSFNVWPTDPQIHVAGAPVQVQPDDPSFRHGFVEVSYPTGEQRVDATTKLFNTPILGYSVLHYLRTDGRPQNPENQPNHFTVVRTVAWNDPAFLVTNVLWTVGQPITNALHQDYPGLNGYVLSTNAYFDGAGTNAAYHLTTRRGPILPVNSNERGEDFLVVWYQQDRIGTSWASLPYQYAVRWPTNAEPIVIASQLGSGPLATAAYPQRTIYDQPNPNLPGFNPNEEHALFSGGTLFALRNDLNARITPKASDPFVLLRYLDPASSEWRMKVYPVVAEKPPFTFRYLGTAGHEIQPPLPISALPLMTAENYVVSGTAWQDYHGRFYAKAAGLDGSDVLVVLRYFYPLQPGFFYDLDRDGKPESLEGDPIPWLDRRDKGSTGQPIDVTYVIYWPQDAPVLQVGQSLTTATDGLPDIADMASAQVIFDSGDPTNLRPLSAVARLFDPLSARSIKLEEDFAFPTSVRRQVDPSTGTEIFPDLPYYLRVRLYHDPRNRLLGFRGFIDAPSDGANPITLVNVMSKRESDVIKDLDPSNDRKFADAIDDLYAVTRNPNRLDLTGDGLPDESLLIGLTTQVVTTNGITTTNLLRENLVGAKALSISQPLLTQPATPANSIQIRTNTAAMRVGPVFQDVTNNFTMELWVLPETSITLNAERTDANDAHAGQHFAVFPLQGAKAYGPGSTGAGISVGTNGVAVALQGDWLFAPTLVYATNLVGWQHVAVVFKDRQPQLYLNGTLAHVGLVGPGDVHPGADISLGDYSDYGPQAGPFVGSISDLRVWNYARTAVEIKADHMSRLTGLEPGLVGLWRFDELTGSIANDSSSRTNAGTLVDAVLWSTNGPPRDPSNGYVVIAENNDASLPGLPVSLHVIRVDDLLARGSLAIIQPDNVLDERVTLRHTADFAGQPDGFVFQWLYQADAAGFDATAVPLTDDNGNITDARNWVAYPTDPPSGLGVNDLTLGTGQLSGLLTLSDVWYLMRYGEITQSGQTNWSSWIGDPSATATAPRAMFVPGWIKRVLGGINLFAQRSSDFDNNQVNTLASTLAEAGPRYTGDVALNPSTTDNFGLIEIYTTVLNRGRSLSIDGVPAVAYEPADKALLLAAGNIADLYLIHANEAFADSADPTIGLTTDSTELGSMASSVFAFQNQVDSLLEEELAMLRGRDDTLAGVGADPVYNRLFWNFTGNEGETAYVAKYGIPDQNSDGFINAGDAKILFPQGHGDAWGHYLSALTTYYDLLRHPNFIWIPRPENTLVAGVPIEVSYQDERRFASAAAARARTGAEIVSRTHRFGYTDDPIAQLQGFPDSNRDRAWSVSGWARRAAQGAYFDWVTGNAILPTVDPSNQGGIQKVDRTTVGELMQIVTESASVMNVLDQADAGLNPLGFARGVVPFDIDPDLLRTGFLRSSHFDQIYQRALQALRNAEVTFNRATVLSSELRKQQNSVSDYSVSVSSQERAYLDDLIEIFGYPYDGDIGPGGTYPSGYQGPDLFHWMYVPTVDVTAQNTPRSKGFTDLTSKLNAIQSVAVKITGNFAAQFSQTTLDAVDPTKATETTVEFPIDPGDYAFETPTAWGDRRAEGSLQTALRELVLAQAQLREALTAYEDQVAELESQADLLNLRYGLRREQLGLGSAKVGLYTVYNALITAAKVTQAISQTVNATYNDVTAGLVRAFPEVLGLSNDIFAPIAASIYVASAFAQTGPTVLAEAAEVAETFLDFVKEETDLGIELQVETNEQDFELAERLRELETSVRAEAPLRLGLFTANQGLIQAARNVESILAQGQRLLVERTNFRKVTAGNIQAGRYRDLGLRIFRDDSLQKYDAQFGIASRYVHLASAAYDYELNLGVDNGAGGSFATEILRERSLGELVNDEPVVGRVGLASILGRMRQNFDVLRGQVGLNNDRAEDSRFSLRSEAFRILPPTGNTNGVNNPADTWLPSSSWQELLQSSLVSNLWDIAEFRRYCRPFAPESAGPQPGIVLRFGTTVTAGQNFFGQLLGPLDSSYDPSEYSTRIKSVAVWFSNYDAANLAAKPRVYLVPVGVDRLRSADADDFNVRDWQVIDQSIPVPFPLGTAGQSNPTSLPIYPSTDGTFAAIRRHSAFRAYQDSEFDLDQFNESTRLVGRSVWNTQWVLIIPGTYLLGDPQQGLDQFIQSVDDIKLFFQTYSVSGN